MSTSQTLPRLDPFIGAPLIGTWTASFLYVAEVLQVVYYFGHFQHDSQKIKIFVKVAIFIDTLALLGDFSFVYLYAVTHGGDAVYLTKQNWTVPLYFISTGVVAALAQSFLVFRYWRFTARTALCLFMFVLVLASLGGNLATGLMTALFPSFADREKVKVAGIVGSVNHVASDFAIATSLVWEFWRGKSMFKDTQRRIKGTLNRLLVLTLQTGSATAVMVGVSVIVYLLEEESNIPLGVTFCLGRVYILSMLLNLNTRTCNTSGSTNVPSSGIRTLSRLGTNRDQVSSVQFRSAALELSAATIRSNVTSESERDDIQISEAIEMKNAGKHPGLTAV